MAMTLNEDEQNRVNNVYNEREKALAENNQLYGDLMNNATEVKNQQAEYLAQQEQTQNQILDKQLANQQNIINQQKEEANKNKRIESNKALNDYNAYVNPYGIQAERMASAGLTNSGVSETSKLGAYTTMQNRLASANASYQKAVQTYDNDINQARLNNDVQKAENALKKLELQLQNNQDYFSNISSLSQAKLKNQQSLRSEYNDQYNTVYNQIMNEQQRAEAIRQFNEEMKFNRDKYNESVRQYNDQMAFDREKQAEAIRQFNAELALSKKKLASSGGSGGSGRKIKLDNQNINSESLSESQNDNTQVHKLGNAYLSEKGEKWRLNEFNAWDNYTKSDLDYVIKKALDEGKITKQDALSVYAMYGITSK